eukprot:s2869_g12.t1
MASKEKSIAEMEEKKKEKEAKKRKARDPVPEQPCQKAAKDDTTSASTKEFGPSDAQKEAEKAKDIKDGSKTLTKGTQKAQEEKLLTKEEKPSKEEALPKGSKEPSKEETPLTKGEEPITKEPLPKGSKETIKEDNPLTKGKEPSKEEKPSFKDILTKGTNKQNDKSLTKGNKKQWQKKTTSPSHQEEPANSADWSRDSSEEYTSSSSSSSPSPPPQKKEKTEKKPEPVLEMRNTKKIAVDWHGVLALGNGDQATYNPYNTCWLDQLVDHGYEVHLLSFCGWKRSREVYRWAWSEWSGWASVNFVWQRIGPQGKSKWCLDHSITKLIDDNMDICRECQKDGIKVYPVADPNKGRKRGQPKLSSCYSDFITAVGEILKEDELP